MGGPVRADEADLEGGLGSGVGAAAGGVFRLRSVRAGGGGAGLPERVLLARFRNPAGDLAAEDCADAGAQLPARRPGAFPAPGRRSDDVDSGSVSARHLDAAGGAGGGDPDRGGGQCADGLEAESEPGPFGEGLPQASARGRVGVLVPGRSESATAAAERQEMRANAGRLWGAPGRQPVRQPTDWPSCTARAKAKPPGRAF